MNINFRGKDWPPIYFDPEFEEILALVEHFDTLRIGLHNEKGRDHLVIASGLGNTHSTLSRALGELNPRLKPSKRDGLKYEGLNGGALILYVEDNKIWFNTDWGGEYTSVEETLPYVKEPARSILKEIVKQVYEKINPL